MLSSQEIVIRLVIAAVLGAAVGLERERLEWVAGLRTHMLVCLGAALVMIVSAYGFDDTISAYRIVLDPSRVAAQVVSGIGFLGAGTILFLRHQIIRGLTTAASLWTIAAVGLAVGGGLYLAAICSTVLILAILALVKPLERHLFRRRKNPHLTVLIDRNASLGRIDAEIAGSGLSIKQMVLQRSEGTAEDDCVECVFRRGSSRAALQALAAKLTALDGVRSVAL